MAVELRFPLYALADALTARTVFSAGPQGRRMLLFTTAENASQYRTAKSLEASVIKMREPKDLRMLFSMQEGEPTFDVEIDPALG